MVYIKSWYECSVVVDVQFRRCASNCVKGFIQLKNTQTESLDLIERIIIYMLMMESIRLQNFCILEYIVGSDFVHESCALP